MKCVYCQNYQFSQDDQGRSLSSDELAGMMIARQEEGCHCLDLVTPTQFLPDVGAALLKASERGLNLPVVYNSSGYERVETLRRLRGVVDVYLVDLRYGDDAVARRLSDALDYVEIGRNAVREMFEQVGLLEIGSDGIAVGGLIVRHLVLPGGLAGTDDVLEWIATGLDPRVHVSLMSQYVPTNRASDEPEINRRITKAEYREAVAALEKYGFTNGWIQPWQAEDGSVDDVFWERNPTRESSG